MPANKIRKHTNLPVADTTAKLPNPSLFILPTELIVMVLHLTDDEGLYSLSLLCRMLHYFALPMFVSRQRGRLTHGFLYLRRSFELLRAVRIALYIQELSGVTVSVEDFKVLKGLGRLISRMRYVQAISFDFLPLCRSMDKAHWQATKELRSCLESLLDKSCTSMTVRGWTLEPKFKVDPPTEIASLTTLQTFNLHNSAISCPSFRTWIICSINASPITTLTLDNFALSNQSMGTDLCLLTLPSLINLSVTRTSVNFRDLAVFLHRHRGISILTFICDTPVAPGSPALTADTLPSLWSLRTTPLCLCHFLRPHGSLPNLSYVEVDPGFPRKFERRSVQLSDEDRIIDMEDSLALLARRDRVSSLAIHLPWGTAADKWLKIGSLPTKGKRRDIERSLTHVKSLKLCSTMGRRVDATTMLLIPKWLALFPDLQCADFGILWGRVSSSEEATFLRAVFEACHSMKDAHLGLSVFSVRDIYPKDTD